MRTSDKGLLLGGLCAGLFLLSIAVGSTAIPLSAIIQVLGSRLFPSGSPSEAAPVIAAIIWNIRLPRALMAFLVGASLSLAGAVMQSLLKNPLASAYTLGVSSGASLGASLVIVFGLSFLGGWTLPFMGFIGGLLTVFSVLAISFKMDRKLNSESLILTGIVLAMFLNGLLTVVTAMSRQYLEQLVFWQLGSLAGRDFQDAGMLTVLVLLGLCYLLYHSKTLDVLSFGEEQALSVGVDAPVMRRRFLTLCALMTGAAVSFVGIIGFVDLMAPHFTRRLFPAGHRLQLPMCALLGGGFMLAADLAARTIIRPVELPIGTVTALLGAPFFAYIYFKK